VGELHVSNQVIARDDLGKFIADIENAAPRLIEASLDAGVDAAKAVTPVDTGRLRNSFASRLLSRTVGIFSNSAPYARWQDEGGDPHQQTGWVTFLWEKRGRMWNPGDNMINHPGNDAAHFMRTGYRAACAYAKANMGRFYPG
jgi:hypothetical protein